MAAFKSVPELVRINGKWTIEPFVPMQAAFDWDKMRGTTGTVYVMSTDGFCKIGITANVKKRLSEINHGSPMAVTLAASRTVPRAGLAYAEAWLHKKFAEHRVKGEWFAMDAEFAVRALPAAVVRAKAYAVCCGQWFAAERIRRQSPERQEKARREYDEFLARAAEMGIEIPAV